jgi:glycosyltransferase involved in cell wall biosynthesis
MRILLATPAYWPAVAFGGPTRAAKELAEELVRQGHDVEVVTTSLRTVDGAPASRRHTHTETIGAVTVHYLATPLRYRWMGVTPSLPLLLRGLQRPDVVHLFGFRDVVTTATSWWARARRIPYVFEPLAMYVPRYRNRPLKRVFDTLLGQPLARHARLVIAVSELERADLIAAGLPAERVVVRSNGFPTPGEAEPWLRRELGLDDSTPLVLNVGRLSHSKGLDLLVEAAAGLPDVHLAIVGPDDNDGTHGRLLKTAGDNVHILGPTDERGVRGAYGEADVFVLPSRTESFGIVAAEAAAQGTAIVVTDHCGIAELLNDRGAIVVPVDASAIRDAIRGLLDDAELRARLGDGARSVARETSWDRVATQQLEIYRRALG